MNLWWLVLIIPGAVILGVLLLQLYLIWVWSKDRP